MANRVTSTMLGIQEQISPNLSHASENLQSFRQQMQGATVNVQELQNNMSTFSSQLRRTQEHLQESANSMNNFANNTSDITAGLTNIQEELQQTEGSFKNFSKTAIDAINTTTKSIGTFILEKAKSFSNFSFKIGAEYEDAMHKVLEATEANEKEFESLKNAARKMGMETEFSATQVAETMEQMGKAGWNAEQIVGGLSGVVGIAAETGEDLLFVSNMLTSGIKAFGMEANSASNFSDVVAKTISNSNVSLRSLCDSFNMVASTAKHFKFSIEEVALVTGLMGNAAIEGKAAGQALSNIISKIYNPKGNAKDKMKELGISFKDLHGNIKPLGVLLRDLRNSFSEFSGEDRFKLAETLVDSKDANAFLSIINASEEDFNRLTWAINESKGATDELAKTTNDTLVGKLKILSSNVQEVGLKFFEALNGHVGKAIDIVVNKLQEWNEDGTIQEIANKIADFGVNVSEKIQGAFVWLLENKEFVVNTFKAITAVLAVGSVVTFAGAIAGAISNVATLATSLAGLMTPTGWIIAGVVALGAIIIANWDRIKTKALEFWETLQEIGSAIKTAFSGFLEAFGQMWTDFLGWIDDKIEKIPFLGDLYIRGKKAIKGVAGWFGGRERENVGKNALGTSYWRGGLTSINERGGEIINLPSGSQIIPHDVSIDMTSDFNSKIANHKVLPVSDIGKKDIYNIKVVVDVKGNIIGNKQYSKQLGEEVAGELLRAMNNMA